MQKCLHSPNKRKSRKLLTMAAFITAMLLSYLVGRHGADKGSVSENYVKPMYLHLYDEPCFEADLANTGYSEPDSEKMNNENIENSKAAVSSAANKAFAVEKTVNILDKSGNIVKMAPEEYVLGCLIGEMPLTFHPQALMAQSVAIRSFTYNKLAEGSKHKNALSCMNPACCQNFVYPNKSGYSQELLNVARQAVKATENIVAVCDNAPINAVYHAGSAEKTKDSAEVWGGEVKYLKSVKSPEGEAQICFSSYSSTGSGHGVGMSQQGANILAKQGKSYREILEYYYSGISLDFVRVEEES